MTDGFPITDALPADVLADMADAGAAVFTDAELARSCTWRYHSGDPADLNPFTGTADVAVATEAVELVRASWRDSQSDEVVVGRYWYMGPATAFTAGTPDTQDILEDGGEVFQVNAVRRDPFGLFYRFDVTRTQ